MNIADFKKENPTYANVEDGKLATALYNKYYANKMPKEQFYKKAGIQTGFLGNPQKVMDYDELDKKEDEIMANTFIPQIPSPSDIIPGLDWVEKTGTKGLRDIGVGLITLPTDIYGSTNLPGADAAQSFSDKLDASIPDVKVTGAQDIAATFIQYGLPSKAAWSFVDKAMKTDKAKALKEALPVIKSLKGKPKKLLEYLSKITGVAIADVAVTSGSDAETVGNIIGGPTEIVKGDSNLMKRIKVGGETMVLAPGIDVALRGAVLPVFKKIYGAAWKPFTKDGREEMVGKYLAEESGVIANKGKKETIDLIKRDEIFKNLDESIELAKKSKTISTTGAGSKNVQLIAIEKALGTMSGTDARLFNTKLSNLTSLNKQLDELTSDKYVDKDEGFAFFKTEADRIKAKKVELEQAKVDAEVEVQNMVDEFATSFKFSDGATASIQLDEIIKRRLKDVTDIKNKNFKAIDPEGTVIVPKNILKDKLKELSKPLNEVQEIVVNRFNSLDIIKTLKNSIRPAVTDANGNLKLNKKGLPIDKGSKDLSYGALQYARPEISKAIGDAKIANDGALVEKLVDLKNVLDDYTQILVDNANAQTKGLATKALNFYKNVYVPEFRQGIGRAFKKAVRSETPWEASMTASKFLLGNKGGSREAVENLSQIIRNSGSLAQATNAVDGYLHNLMARSFLDKNGKVVAQRMRLFKRDFEEVLNKFPDTKKKFNEFYNKIINGQKKVNELEIKVKDQFDKNTPNNLEAQLNAAETMINKNPVDAINSVFSSGTDHAKKMKQLIDLAKKDPSGEALAGIKAALREWVWNKSTSNQARTLPLPEDIYELSRSQVNKLLNNNSTRKALNQLFTKNEMSVLDNVKNKLNEMDNINAQITTGSPTAVIEKAVDRVRIIMASYYGIVKGRGIFAISKFVMQALGFKPKELAAKVLTDAMLDPELAKKMLLRATTKNDEMMSNRMRLYVTNNLLTKEQEEVNE